MLERSLREISERSDEIAITGGVNRLITRLMSNEKTHREATPLVLLRDNLTQSLQADGMEKSKATIRGALAVIIYIRENEKYRKIWESIENEEWVRKALKNIDETAAEHTDPPNLSL